MVELTNPRDYPLKGLRKVRFRFEYHRGPKARKRLIEKIYQNTYGNEDLSYRAYIRTVDQEFSSRFKNYRLYENEVWDLLCRGVYYERINYQSIFHWLKGHQAAQAHGRLGDGYPVSERKHLAEIPHGKLVRTYVWVMRLWKPWSILLGAIVTKLFFDPAFDFISRLIEELTK